MNNSTAPLPDTARLLAARLGCEAGTPLSHVDLRQVGQMRENADAAWMRFDARQRIELASCAFEWKARTGPLRVIHIEDSFTNGAGRLAVKLFGVFDIAGATSSAQLDRGELLRYLAELAWAPDAILRNRALRWRDLDHGRLAVSAGAGERRAEILITLDQDGRIAEVFVADRPRAMGARFELCAWRGAFSDYRWIDGRLIPMSAQVGWVGASHHELVWRGRITEWSAA